MKFSRSILSSAVAVAISALALPASAVTYTLNNGGSAFPNPGDYGTVMLTQGVGVDSANVFFVVDLNDAFSFVNTGNPSNSHAAFTFNATDILVTDIQSIVMTGATSTYAAIGPSANSPFGSFGYGIYSACTGNCPASGPLTFTVVNAVVSDFLSFSTGGIPALFAADILGAGGVTGAVGVTTPVPEPGTYALMLAGLGVVGFMARRRRQA